MIEKVNHKIKITKLSNSSIFINLGIILMHQKYLAVRFSF